MHVSLPCIGDPARAGSEGRESTGGGWEVLAKVGGSSQQTGSDFHVSDLFCTRMLKGSAVRLKRSGCSEPKREGKFE